MCLFRKKKVKSIGSDSDPFGLEKRQREAEIIAASVKVGDVFHRRWHEPIGNIMAHIVADYTVIKIEGDLITLEAPHEKTLQFTREEFKTELCYEFTKIQ